MKSDEKIRVERVDRDNPEKAIECLLNGGSVFGFEGKWFMKEKSLTTEELAALESLRELFSYYDQRPTNPTPHDA